jgi:hypothetical protein
MMLLHAFKWGCVEGSIVVEFSAPTGPARLSTRAIATMSNRDMRRRGSATQVVLIFSSFDGLG